MSALARAIASFQINESPQGDWNIKGSAGRKASLGTFKLTNPRKGTETYYLRYKQSQYETFKLTNPRKGTETANTICQVRISRSFQINESPQGDWNMQAKRFPTFAMTFKLTNPRKGTETHKHRQANN